MWYSLHVGLFTLAAFKVTSSKRVHANTKFLTAECLSTLTPLADTRVSVCVPSAPSDPRQTKASLLIQIFCLCLLPEQGNLLRLGPDCLFSGSFVLHRLEKFKQPNAERRWWRIPNGTGKEPWNPRIPYIV
ncbi:hypothetical protein ABG768_017508 [Culter alburnus]|uniref:Secreted protein n=1 Tax=Culter alburnus TaxID=194366 RepID=A0AAW1YXY5_CULAL